MMIQTVVPTNGIDIINPVVNPVVLPPPPPVVPPVVPTTLGMSSGGMAIKKKPRQAPPPPQHNEVNDLILKVMFCQKGSRAFPIINLWNLILILLLQHSVVNGSL